MSPASILTPERSSEDTDIESLDHGYHPHRMTTLSPVQSRVEKPKSLTREVIFVGLLCMAQFMTQAGLGISIAPLHIIGESFGIQDGGQLSWFASSYSLTVGTFILIAGRLGDVFGHKRFFIAGFLWFALWSLLAGFSVYSTQVFFDCCRALQGIGPAFLLPNAIAILGRTYQPGRRKEMIFSIFGATAPGGFLFGAVVSSLFGQLVWWPWAYWVMAILCLVFAAAGLFVIPHTPPPVFEDSVSIMKRTDATGSVLGVSGLVLVNFAWNQGPVTGWETPYVYILLIVGVLVLGLFAVNEHRVEFPLLPFDVFTSQTGFVLACVALGWSSFGIWIFYIFQILEELRHLTPLLAAAQFSPASLSGLCAAITTGVILSRVPASMVMLTALTAFTVGGILVATVPVDQTYWAQTFVAIILMPWGMDMSFPASTILLSNAMHHDNQGIAASLVNTVINYSISIGLGIAGTVESQVNHDGAEVLQGYRGAQYVGIGLSGFGMLVSGAFVLSERKKRSNLSTNSSKVVTEK